MPEAIRAAGKAAVDTGATLGIGGATAEAAAPAEHGARVFAEARRRAGDGRPSVGTTVLSKESAAW